MGRADAHGTVETVTIANDTGMEQGELLVFMDNTDFHDVVVTVNPPGCPPPSVVLNGPLGPQVIFFTWSCDCVQPGDSLTFTFHTLTSNSVLVSGWFSRGICPSGDLHGDVSQEAETAYLNSTVDKDESHRRTFFGDDCDSTCPNDCPT